MNSLDRDIKFNFRNVSTVSNFSDVSYSIKYYQLKFNINHKPTHSFSYKHPQVTKNNIVLSLRQIIVRIVSANKENMEQHFNKLKSFLAKRGHPKELLDYTMTKLFSPSI